MMFSCSCLELTSSYLIVHGSWFSKSAKSFTLRFSPCSGWQVWRCIHNTMADTHPPLHVHTARLMITELRVAAAPPRTPEVSWTVLPRLLSPPARVSWVRADTLLRIPSRAGLHYAPAEWPAPRVYLSHAIGIISIRLSPNSRDGTDVL